MRPSLWVLVFLGSGSVFAQPFSAGIKAGVPLTDFVNSVQSGTFDYSAQTQRYIIGGTAELHLPLGLAIELDALYRHFEYTATGGLPLGSVTQKTSAGNWEFPLLLKYRFPFPVVRPYLDGGVAWDTFTGLKQTISEPSNPFQVNKSGATGFVLGGGIDIHAIVLHISPELRYTRWFSAPVTDVGGGLQAGQNQLEFLVGFTF
jgi:hypothetical protein